MFFASLTMSEVLFTLLFVLALLLVAARAACRRSGEALVIAFGVVATAAAFTRGQALMLLPLGAAGWSMAGMQWRRAIGWGILAGGRRRVAVGAVGSCETSVQLNSPVIIATNVGGNLWLGSHAGSAGRMQSDQPLPLPSRVGLHAAAVRSHRRPHALRKGLAYMLTHPADEVRLAGLKVRALYESDATGLDWNSAYDDGFYPGNLSDWLRNTANGFWFIALAIAGVGLIAERGRLTRPLALLPLTLLAGRPCTSSSSAIRASTTRSSSSFALFAARGARGAVRSRLAPRSRVSTGGTPPRERRDAQAPVRTDSVAQPAAPVARPRACLRHPPRRPHPVSRAVRDGDRPAGRMDCLQRPAAAGAERSVALRRCSATASPMAAATCAPTGEKYAYYPVGLSRRRGAGSRRRATSSDGAAARSRSKMMNGMFGAHHRAARRTCSATRLFDRRVGFGAGAMLAIFPSQVFYTGTTLSEPLFTLLLVASLLVLVWHPWERARHVVAAAVRCRPAPRARRR